MDQIETNPNFKSKVIWIYFKEFSGFVWNGKQCCLIACVFLGCHFCNFSCNFLVNMKILGGNRLNIFIIHNYAKNMCFPEILILKHLS